MSQEKAPYKPLIKFAFELANTYRFWALGLCACIIVLSACGPLNVLLISAITNKLLTNTSDTIVMQLLCPSLLLLLNAFMYDLALQAWDIINNKLLTEVKTKVILFACKNALQQNAQFCKENNANKIMQNIKILLTSLHAITGRISMLFISSVVRIFISVLIMSFINILFFVSMSIFIMSYGIITYVYYKKIESLATNNLQADEDVSAVMLDLIARPKNIKYEDNPKIDFLSIKLTAAQKACKNKINLILKCNVIKNSCFVMFFAIILCTLIYLKAYDAITTRNFIVILGLCINIGNAIWVITEQLANFSDNINKARIYLQKLFVPYVFDNKKLVDLIRSNMDIKVSNTQTEENITFENAQEFNDCTFVA